VPALIIIAPGSASVSVASDDPQSLQNFRESGFPLSPLSAYDARLCPCHVKLGAGTTTFTENADPDTF
jgi:hypothetical protein